MTMAEMHLDLCIQSTNHLLETVSNIKENVRMLEVFLNSGLMPVESPENGAMSGEYSTSEGRGSIGPDPRFYPRFQFGDETTATSRHANCCCMCRFRKQGSEGINGRASAVTASLSSNPSSSKKSRIAPPVPRLNRTASLRRETVLQRQHAQELKKKSFF